MTVVCEICGNETAWRLCPFCGHHNDGVSRKKMFRHKVVNLENGRPPVDIALRRMEQALADATLQGINVLTLIHGYGSSGKGGIIRKECRKMLDYMANNGAIAGFIPGEMFRRHNAETRRWMQRYPLLAENNDLGRGNQGITIVVL